MGGAPTLEVRRGEGGVREGIALRLFRVSLNTELALLTHKPRAASVHAVGQVVCAGMCVSVCAYVCVCPCVCMCVYLCVPICVYVYAGTCMCYVPVSWLVTHMVSPHALVIDPWSVCTYFLSILEVCSSR